MRKIICLLTGIFLMLMTIHAQDTTVVQTFDYNSTTRSDVFQFPTTPNTDYEKIIMLYSMRCKDGLVSTGTNRNLGCGEWDYSCGTYITDSSKTDSVKTSHPSHIISNFNGTTYNYTTNPTYTYTQYRQKEVVYTSTISQLTATVGSGTNTTTHPFSTAQAINKTQYLIRAAEITGLSTNAITGLSLDINSIGSNVDFLRIKMKNTSQMDLDSSDIESGLKEVYFLNTNIPSTGAQEFNFYTPFNWDGTSNVLVELSYRNSGPGSNSTINGTITSFNSALHNDKGEDNYLSFNGAERVSVPVGPMSTVSDEITISFWSFGDSLLLPRKTSILGATDANDNRQLNVHLPWDNSRVYWDCGNDGSGYDRLERAVNPEDFKGKWNHWAFTKNATTGRMRIFVNGAVFHTGFSRTKPIDIKAFEIGGSVTGSHGYYGKVDEFSVWNVELSLADIQALMHKDIEATHPNYANLVAYYQFNEGTGATANDASPFNETASITGVPVWGSIESKDLYRNFVVSKERPNITLIEGTYTSTTTTTVLLDSVQNPANRVDGYQFVNKTVSPLDTNYYFQAGYTYVYDDSSNAIVDSVMNNSTNTINIITYNYFNYWPTKYEIMSFVTPYGIGLDFGMEGKTWAFDVTDFGPILNGPKRISLERGGQWQEDMDIKFLFIKGTPTRDVLDIRQIWPVTSQSYTRILSDDRFESRTLDLLSTASQFKIRTVISGHGQQGEFIPRSHFLNIDGGPRELEWTVWTECADNPIYPQGGTWIYDRAGWCPGAPTDVQNLDITSMVSPGTAATFDYGMAPATGDSRYFVNSQLVSYGSPNFTLDAAISEIISPSLNEPYGRFNPICGQPVIKIKNNGSSTLTELDINYSVVGGVPSSFHWTGSLDFLEEEDVTLPLFNWTGDGTHTFTVSIDNPNAATDEYSQNNELSASYNVVPRYNKDFVIIMRTNNRGNETSYELTDMDGNVVFSRTGNLGSGQIYRDTMRGLNQCLLLKITDSDDDGLSFFANSDGSGYIRMANLGEDDVDIATDFGKEVNYQFIAGFPVGVEEKSKAQYVDVFPNPAQGVFNVNLRGYQGDVQIEVYNQLGQVQYQKNHRITDDFKQTSVDLSQQADGIYMMRILQGDNVQIKKLIKS